MVQPIARSLLTLRLAAIGVAAAFGLLCAPGAARAIGLPGVDHGRQIAQSNCAMCHEIDAAGRSPIPAAPAFGELRLRFNTIALERTLTRLNKQGHFAMPPHPLPQSDAEDLAAYIGSLTPAAH